LCKRNIAGVDLEDRLAPGLIREVNHHAPIEAAGPQERFVEYIRLIGRCQHDDTLAAGEAIHFGEDLVQGLLLLARATDRHLPARATDGVELVDEDDRRRVLSRLLEEVRTRAAPTPTIISTNSAALIEKNGTPASPAIAFANRVFPVPGAPTSSTPFGAVPPRRVYFLGSLRKSTISTNSF